MLRARLGVRPDVVEHVLWVEADGLRELHEFDHVEPPFAALDLGDKRLRFAKPVGHFLLGELRRFAACRQELDQSFVRFGMECRRHVARPSYGATTANAVLGLSDLWIILLRYNAPRNGATRMFEFVRDYLPAVLFVGFVVAVWVWHMWEARLRPALISQAEIDRLADELIARHGPHAEEAALIEEDSAWRRSHSYEQGLWRRVRREIWRRYEAGEWNDEDDPR